MNFFTIFAHGDNFDPDAYLKHAAFTFDRIWHRGDPRGCPEFIQDEHPTSGVEKILGDGRRLSIYDQDWIAATFLERHAKELRELAAFPGVETFLLGLQYRIDFTSSLSCFCMSPSPRLMYFALKAGVVPTFYVDVQHAADSEEVC